MRLFNTLLAGSIIGLFSCYSNKEYPNVDSFAPKMVEAKGYVVPRDSMAEPKVVPAGEPKVVRAGKPKVVYTNTNVHPAGVPKVVKAGVPKVCTPGQDGFSLPKTVPAIGRSFLAGIPEVVMAKEADTKDVNPQNFSSFGKLQGLKSNKILCLYEDISGNLWIGTNGGGLSKYDGKTFTHFTVKQGLTQNFINSIIEDKDGNLWFATGLGVNKYDGRNFTQFTVKDGLNHNWITCMLKDRIGHLWFGTNGGGISSFDGKSFTHFTVNEGLINNYVSNIYEDKSGILWFGTAGGVSKYNGTGFANFTEKEGLSHNQVRCILEDKDGHLWFGTQGGGVNKYELPKDGQPVNFTHFTVKVGLSSNMIYSSLEDKSGNLWFGTYGGGVSKYEPPKDGKVARFTHFTEKEGLNYEIWDIMEDKSGNIWIGSGGGGVSKYDGKRFTHFTENEGLFINSPQCVLADKQGNLWIGGFGGVSKNGESGDSGKSFTHFTTQEGLIHNLVWTMTEDKAGNLWFGTLGGVSKYDGKSFTHFTEKEGLINNDVKTILEDGRGDFWFGAIGGISKYDGKSFTQFTEKEGLNKDFFLSLAHLQDKSGNLWFGSAGGVEKYTALGDASSGFAGQEFIQFTEKEGLTFNTIWNFLQDSRGNIWIGTAGGGINKYDDKGFTHFTEREGLSNNFIASSMEDKSGNLWFATADGLNKLEKNRLTSFHGNKINEPASGLINNRLLFKTYTYDDGFSGIGVNYGKTICEAKDGTIWICANDRLTAFHPGEETADTLPPNIQLTGLALFNENIAWQNYLSSYEDSSYNARDVKDTSFILGNGVKVHDFHFDSVSRWYGVPENLSLAYDNNYLTFQFVGITLKSPKKVKYQYKLDGLDYNWSAITSRSEATYGNLPHGDYIFNVKAMNGEGYWTEALTYPFKIRPPWWFTWWAYSIYGLMLGLSVGLIHRFQKQRVLRVEREKSQAKELVQAKEIEKAYNQLGQAHENLKATQSQLIHAGKMASLGELTAGIAHEIQNPLNFVNNFSEINKELLEELKGEINKENLKGQRLINDIESNEQKIIQHGKRADIIVKGMLQHSRSIPGKKEITNINNLCSDYIRLAYHARLAGVQGLQAIEPQFQARIETHLDPALPKIQVVPQELGRALLNILNNAFDAVAERSSQLKSSADERSRQGLTKVLPPVSDDYQPTLILATQHEKNKVIIKIADNGPGIPDAIKDKIFQPFFTTKPTGQGTGLGLSLAYDIITKGHGGALEVWSEEGQGSEFVIHLPLIPIS